MCCIIRSNVPIGHVAICEFISAPGGQDAANSINSINTQATAARVRPELLRLLDDLPQPKQIELLNFARFLRQQAKATTDAPHGNSVALHTVPAGTLVDLTGLVGLGGDAVPDTEALYDGV